MICNISGVGEPSSNFSNPCVSNASLGSVYINTSNRDVYIRTKVSVPSLAGDFESICSVIDTCVQVDSSVVSFDDTAVPVNCNTVINGTTVQQALVSLACAIRVPLLNLMEFFYTGPCTLTTTNPDNLQDLFNGLLCRDEEILGKTFGWGVQGDATRTIAEGATVSNVLMRSGDTVIGSTATVVTNSKLSVVGSVVFGDLSTATISGTNNAILGGAQATISSGTSNAVIVGGNSNLIQSSAARSVIVGGEGQIVFGVNNGIFAGLSNTIANGSTQAAILGGTSNTVDDSKTIVAGGQGNTANGNNSAVVGGQSNFSAGTDDVIIGGQSNTISTSSFQSVILGSLDSTVDYGTGPGIRTILAGCLNTLFLSTENVFAAATNGSEAYGAVQSSVIGGSANILDGAVNSVILGGTTNNIQAAAAVILGGSGNTIEPSGQNSSIIFGTSSIVSAGASLAGGTVINVEAPYSIGIGRNVHVNAAHSGSFVWQCNDAATFNSAATNEFAAKANGGVRFRTNSAGTTGMDMAAGGSSWVAVSSAAMKDNFEIVNTESLLDKFRRLEIFTFNYKDGITGVFSDKNIGTTAEQWNETFAEFITPKFVKNAGQSIAGISQMDAIGILLGVVKELSNEIEKLKKN